MSAANARLALDAQPFAPPQNAQQRALHPELSTAHIRFIGLNKTYRGKPPRRCQAST